jgi:hypothetical protein
MWLKIKEFITKYEPKIVLVTGFALVAVISFQTGMIKGKETREKPLIIEKPTISQAFFNKDNNNAPEAQNLTQDSQTGTDEINTQSKKCEYIGSKNSNKYHLPNCRWAKNIKPENLTCFKDKIDAESKGYLPDKNCIK